jgi:hypothetical protein
MMVSRKDSFENTFNNRSDHPTDIEDAPDVLSLAVERMNLLQRLEGVEKENQELSKDR